MQYLPPLPKKTFTKITQLTCDVVHYLTWHSHQNLHKLSFCLFPLSRRTQKGLFKLLVIQHWYSSNVCGTPPSLHAKGHDSVKNYLKDNREIVQKWFPTENKKDKRRELSSEQERLVCSRHTQEEGIDYRSLCTLARIDAIRIGEYLCQPPGFEDLTILDKVNKEVKCNIWPASITKSLFYDRKSLMYLTSSRPRYHVWQSVHVQGFQFSSKDILSLQAVIES
ncbi:hypothetical protein Tco_1335139 [Tanacetum coccineum]